jgi:hypothetical protein
MSTIKSSDEHLTLNADGSSKDIKFQANGVEKASISSSGAFTSTTIDATKLTGNLPAISAASLTNIPAANITGTLPAIDGSNLTGVGVAGISSSADATAMTINSAEQVGIGTANPENYASNADDLVIYSTGTTGMTIATNNTSAELAINFADGDSGNAMSMGSIVYQHASDKMRFGCANDYPLYLYNKGAIIYNNLAITSSTNYGPFVITLSDLFTLDSNQWWQFGLRVTQSGIVGGATAPTNLDAIISIRGLSSWNQLASVRNLGEHNVTASITASSSNSMSINITNPNGSNQGAYMVQLFANSGAKVTAAA